MNSRISVDLHEDIVIKTDTCPTAGELLAAVCEYPFLIDVIIEQTLPKLQKYAEDNFGCELKIDTLYMIEGHTSVKVTIKHSAGKEDVSLVISILKEDRLIPLLKTIVKTLAGFLPLPIPFVTTVGTNIKIRNVLESNCFMICRQL